MVPNLVTTVILVRHADRTPPPAGTPDYPGPSLNDKGKIRASTLDTMLRDTGIQAVYTSRYLRAKQTAEPFLIHHPGITPVELDTAPELKNAILTHNAGQTVLVVGHSNTVPELIGLLGGPSLPIIDDCEFDNFFVLVKHSATKASLTMLKYGERTSAPC